MYPYVFVFIHIYICMYVYIYGGFPFVLMKGIDHGPSPVVHALPSEARHARSEATRVGTPNCT